MIGMSESEEEHCQSTSTVRRFALLKSVMSDKLEYGLVPSKDPRGGHASTLAV